MRLEVVAALLAAGVAAAFSTALWRRYTARGRANRALLTWAFTLAMFAIASGALALGATTGWTGASYRTFYLFGGVFVVPWLALGTVQTATRDPVILRILGAASFAVAGAFLIPMLAADEPVLYGIGVALGTVWGALLVTGSPAQVRAGSLLVVATFSGIALFAVLAGRIAIPLPPEGVPDSSRAFEAGVRGFAVGGNALGAILVVVGSIVSAIRLRRAGARDLIVGNALIAAGVVVAGTGGAFAFLGDVASHAIAFTVGVTIMYAGFVRTTRSSSPGPIEDPGRVP